MKSLVGKTFGKYKVNRMLGKGGMGEVYEAYDTEKGRSVALKVLADQYSDNEGFRTRFLRESRAAAILQEPHVIPIHDWGEIDRTLYIDMRLVDGRTLHDMLKSKPLEPQRAVDIVRQVAAALDAAHTQGLIHRDVKPQNIIVTPDDFAYLVDFGIAEAKGETHLTMAGCQVGTWDYMAPERFGEQEATTAVDIYSLACVLYEALTGRKPFPGQSQQVMAAHLTSPPPRPTAVNSLVPAGLDDVIARGMAKHPDYRYGSAGALGRAARRALTADSSISSGTKTVLAPQPAAAAPSSPPRVYVPSLPPAGSPPPAAHQTPSSRPSGGVLLGIVVGVAAALVVIVVGVLIAVVTANRESSPSSPSTTLAYSNPVPSTYAPEPTPDTVQSNLSTTATTAVNTSLNAEQQLQQIASDDRPFVSAQLADHWVAQISSKRPGVVDNGVTWDDSMALQEHLQLRQRYGASLLWSGDWSTFSDSNFWVTVVNVAFADSAGALQWCRSHALDNDHCLAKIVSTTHPVAGSTAYN